MTAGQNGCAGDLIGSAVQRLYTVSNLDAEARGLTEQLQTIDSLLNVLTENFPVILIPWNLMESNLQK